MRWMTSGLFLALGSIGCSSDENGSQPPAGETGGAAGSTVAATGGSGMSSGGTGTGAQGGTATGGTGGDSLPNGGREYKTIVNIVDSGVVKSIEANLASDTGPETYASATQAFYALYPDEYDFLYFVLDHETGSTTFASAEVVNRPVIPGTGIDSPQARLGYGTHGRLKVAVGTQSSATGGMPPFAHETMHYWGVNLDSSFGFGKDRDEDYGPHWGVAGVFGQLGGFDPATLRCANPPGASPPACTAESNGRFRYTMSAFGPNTNSYKGVPYAPLELYLTGLVSVADVPTPIPLLQDASIVSIDIDADTSVVEAAGVSQIAMSAIVTRHGARAPATDAEKHFSGAFVLVTEVPATTAVLDRVVGWQEAFGNPAPGSGYPSFEEHTGGRATMETRIGRRLTASDPPAVPPVPDTCHPLAQDCGNPDLGCYSFDQPTCFPRGNVARGGLCTQETDCAPGNGCIPFDFNSPDMKCGPYCDPNDPASSVACGTLCPGNYVEVYGGDGLSLIGGICLP